MRRHDGLVDGFRTDLAAGGLRGDGTRRVRQL